MPKKITIPDVNGWDPNIEEFVDVKGATLILEHSLISLQKWEAKWHKPYLNDKNKTPEETVDYIRCMTTKTIPNEIDDRIYNYIPENMVMEIVDYINDPMTATKFSNGGPGGGKPSREKITAEIIYYWMIALSIPMEYRKWHLNQLLTLIRVCEIKQSPGKKMGKQELAARNRALNAQRRAALHTHG